MKDLVTKVREAVVRSDAQTKCALVGQLYEQIDADLKKVSSRLDTKGLEGDVIAFDSKLDELESICDELLKILNSELQKVLKFLKPRFEAHMYRHADINWEQVEKRLREADPKKIWSLSEMERTGGEPDVIGIDEKTGQLIFEDRAPESPIGRRNCCYDAAGEKECREKYKETCSGNAVDMATAMGVDLLDRQQYMEAQKVDKLDSNTWSWIRVSSFRRSEGGALRGMLRKGHAYVRETPPNNPSGVAGWRGTLRI